MKLKSLAIAAPAYNESECIREVVESWHEYLKNNKNIEQYEIIICNDGSTDETERILKELADEISVLRIINLKRNKGAAFALACAIQATEAEWVALLDTDGQFPVENIDVMSQHLKDGVFAIIGNRKKKHDKLITRIGSWLSSSLCNMIYNTQLKDFNSANKLINGKTLRGLVLEASGLNYSTEITAKLIEAGVEINEVIVDHQSRTKGKSNMKFIRDGLHRLLFVIYLAIRFILIRWKIINNENKGEYK
jgi:glycosyltransferase involved in cell wall biosynthesis